MSPPVHQQDGINKNDSDCNEDDNRSGDTSDGVISVLPSSVIHHIAAGEVIQRPVNVIKELIDNSVDAGAGVIRVVVREGGLQLIQVSDDGEGIAESNLDLLCVRHATSKLRSEEDLEQMQTLGFRGEALSSMSYVAHLSCITKKRKKNFSLCNARVEVGSKAEGTSNDYVGTTNACDNDEGYAIHAKYRNGELIEKTATAGTCGTSIIIENLFYCTPMRKKALRNAGEEYRRIVDTVSRYAIHHTGVAFSCRRQEDGMKAPDIQVGMTDSVKTRIDMIYGHSVASNLMELTIESNIPNVQGQGRSQDAAQLSAQNSDFSLKGFISNANYVASRTTLILFINGRLVEMTPLRRAIESVYASILPKASKPFLYLSIETAYQNVDVNLHPTKHEVGLVNADDIISDVQTEIEKLLLQSNDGRTFLPQSQKVQSTIPFRNPQMTVAQNSQKKQSQVTKDTVYAPNRMVRTDAASIPLEAFALCSQQLRIRQQSQPTQTQLQFSVIPKEGDYNDKDEDIVHRLPRQDDAISHLRAKYEENTSKDLLAFFRSHVYVGMVTVDRALVQFHTGLYCIDVVKISQELCYQILLKSIVNDCCQSDVNEGLHHRDIEYGIIRFEKPLPIGETVRRALQALEQDGHWEEEDKKIEDVASEVVTTFHQNREYLSNGFKVFVEQSDASNDIAKGNCEMYLTGLPACFGEQYTPEIGRLPDFLLEVARLDWSVISAHNREKSTKFVDMLCRAIAELFTFVWDDDVDDGMANSGDSNERGEWKMQHVISPLLKSSFHPQKEMNNDGTIVMITKLERLYKVFERC